MAVSLNVQNVAWNTAVTFGIACVSGAVTWTISKAAHRCFRIRENIMHSPSLAVREAAAIAAGAATYALASRATLVSFPVDAQFCKFHCLHLIFGTLFSLYGIILNSPETRTGAMMFGSVGTLLLFSASGSAGNRVPLFAAGGIGVIMGLRVLAQKDLMTTARIHTGDMVWNTAMTFGCALVGGATGWVASKIARRYFNKPTISDALGFMASTYIPIIAVSVLAYRVKIMTFPFDQRFRGFHSLHPLFSVGLFMLSSKVYDEKRQRMSVICALTGILFLFSIASGVEKSGPFALSIATGQAGITGAIMPLYSTF